MQRQALETLKTCVENSERPVFPCALIAGDVVILELLSKLDYLKNGTVAVAFVDTFHLFPETMTFLHQLEVRGITSQQHQVHKHLVLQGLHDAVLCMQEKYGFKAKEFHAGITDY